ncbi:hypothetical protein LG634_16645 [Streptomyces bambusae]|uniref:hypothetical protein n=1 Tax=Streptomyces bambusae TaxID=1550616 RepID=UPI001CFE5863|nr:hypothetical protein [Streptomyces bambusae]MCB5166461.1 hypothetical protein [Streptomyces bambusae]
MHLMAGGTTPLTKPVWADDLVTDDGHAFELVSPVLLLPGDRLAFEETALVVTRAGGTRVRHPGNWATRCRRGSVG